MVSKKFSFNKPSGFCVSVTISIVDTPKGKMRSFEIKDHEPFMTDGVTSDTIVLLANDFDTVLGTPLMNTFSNDNTLKEMIEFLVENC
jgi:hypothetical protein